MMTDLIPVLIDGAVICNAKISCKNTSNVCEECLQAVICFHNWLRQMNIKYSIIDFLDEKSICPVFVEEIIILRKKNKIPFLFAGVTSSIEAVLEQFSPSEQLPLFLTPEDAVRALRLQYPGATESSVNTPINYGEPLTLYWRSQSQENSIGRVSSL